MLIKIFRQNHERLTRAVSLVLMIALALGMLPALLIANPSKAYAVNASLVVGRSIPYDAYSTNRMTADGKEAYCTTPQYSTPASGSFAKSAFTASDPNRNQEAAANVWFAFGGPGFDKSMWPATWYDGSAMTDDRYAALSHILLSDTVSSSGQHALYGCSEGFKNWVRHQVLGFDAAGNVTNTNATGRRIATIKHTIPTAPSFQPFLLRTGSGKQDIVSFTYNPEGTLDIQKVSANPDITNGNSNYSLNGAIYGVYKDNTCTNQVATLTTNASGYASSITLDAGTYYVKEKTAPKGYWVDTNIYETTINAGKAVRVNGGDILEIPKSDPARMFVGKYDSEKTYRDDSLPQGSASLAGAEYTVRYYVGQYTSQAAAEGSGAPKRTWVVRTNENGKALLHPDYLVSGDNFYYDRYGAVTIPIGTLLIQETKAPSGYQLPSPSPVFVRQYDGTNMADTSIYNPPTQSEVIKRGDLQFVKIRASSQQRMEGIPFKLTSATTGESHIVVTDANGEVNTNSSYNKHSTLTNANDAALNADGTVDHTKLNPDAGIWFGAGSVNDSRGALVYDTTYKLEELSVPANRGYALVTVEGISITREGYTLDMDRIDNYPTREMGITTVARDAQDGDKFVSADSNAVIIDRVNYSNADAAGSAEFEAVATLMDRTTGDIVKDADGNDVSVTRNFPAGKAAGYYEVEIPFDARNLVGRDIVVYEEIRDAANHNPICDHKDIADYEQTVRIVAPGLKGIATDFRDGDKVVTAESDSVIVDTISYSSLSVGTEYEIEATLMQKVSGRAVEYKDKAGNVVSVTQRFIPEASSGQIKVNIPVDTLELANQSLTVFVKLKHGEEIITTLQDINSEAQTVVVRATSVKGVATDVRTGGKTVMADSEANIKSKLYVSDAIKGKTYGLHALLVNPVTGLPVISAGPEIPTETLVAFLDDWLAAAGYQPVLRSQSDPTKPATVPGIVEREPVDENGAPVDSGNEEDKGAGGDSSNTEDSKGDTPETVPPEDEGEDMVGDLGPEPDPSEYPLVDVAALFEQGASGLVPEGSISPIAINFTLQDVAKNANWKFDGVAFDRLALKYPDIMSRLCRVDKEFVAKGGQEFVEIEYKLDATGLAGTDAVSICFIEDQEGRTVCGEVDFASSDETVTFISTTITTFAFDGTDENKVLLNSRQAKLVDRVTYSDVVPGVEYKVSGVLYDKATNSPLMVNDQIVKAKATFVPRSSKGYVDVEFEFDASALVNSTVVVYEKLSRQMEIGEDVEEVVVATHEDINDADQTVEVNIVDPGTTLEKTGVDMPPIQGVLAFMTLAGIIGAGVTVGRRNPFME